MTSMPPLSRSRRLLAALLGSACLLPAPLLAQDEAYDLGTIRYGVNGPLGPEDSVVAERTNAGSRIDTAIIDLSAAVSVITEEELRQRGVEDIPQALSYTAGVTVDEYGGDDRYDFLRIRGFYDGGLGYYRDGLPLRILGFTGSRLEPSGLQRVEVLKGSTSSLFGLNAPGGLVNAITNRPLPEAFGEATAIFGDEHLAFGYDTGGPLAEGSDWSWRITAYAQDGTNDTPFSRDDRVYVAPALTWAPSARTSITVLADYNRRTDNAGNSVPAGLGLDPDTYLSEPDFDRVEREEWNIGWDASHEFGGGLTLSSTARWTRLDLTYESVYGPGPTAATPRPAYAVDGQAERFAINAQLLYDRSFGTTRSRTLLGVDHSNDEVEETYNIGFAPGIDPFDPVYTGRDSIVFTFTSDAVTELESTGLFLQEELTFADRWIVTLGGRYDWVTQTAGAPGATTDFDDEAFTSRAGLTYKATPGLSVYANYSESFQPTSTFDRTLVANVDPQEGTQYELGVKFSPAGSDALFTAAIFDLSQTNLVTQVEPLVYEQTGEVRVRGAELEGRWQMAEGLSLIASYALWDAEIVEDDIGGNEGNRPAFTPEHVASLWVDYALPVGGREVSLGAGLRYIGGAYADDANLNRLDGYTTIDAAVGYQLTEDVALRLTATNLLDEREVTQVDTFNSTTYYSDPREVRASLTYVW